MPKVLRPRYTKFKYKLNKFVVFNSWIVLATDIAMIRKKHRRFLGTDNVFLDLRVRLQGLKLRHFIGHLRLNTSLGRIFITGLFLKSFPYYTYLWMCIVAIPSTLRGRPPSSFSGLSLPFMYLCLCIPGTGRRRPRQRFTLRVRGWNSVIPTSKHRLWFQ